MNLWDLTDLCTPWCIHVAATLRIADHIASGTSDIGPLAAASGAHRESLERVLRHLASKGVFEEPSPGRFALNDMGRGLLDEQLRTGLDLEGIGGRMAHSWGTLLSAVRSGRPAYHEAFGRGFWEDLETHPGVAASFDALMGAGHGTPDPHVLLEESDWSEVHTVVDVGGGTGSLLAEVLRSRPGTRGILVDLPRAVAASMAVFQAAGVADRVQTVAQTFFDPLPPGADLYLLKSVLSDWPDREAAAILKRCAEAARPGGRVVAVNGVTSEEIPYPDLLMMVLVGGKQRTLPEFEVLAREAGLKVRAAGQKAGRFLVECVPVVPK